jgi:hypothetical protein
VSCLTVPLKQNGTCKAMQQQATVNAAISPRGGLEVLSRTEVSRLRDASQGGLHELLRRCALAVLTSGSPSDDPRAALARYPDFNIEVQQHDRGIKLEVSNAPADAFVDGSLIVGVRELLFAVVRDIAYVSSEIQATGEFDLSKSDDITSAVFEILRNARVLRSEPGGVLGRAFDRSRGIHLHQGGRLRTRPARL